MISFPNAKINLGLKVLNKRVDGYHNLETIFYPIPLCDILEIVKFESKSDCDNFIAENKIKTKVSSFKLTDSLIVNFYMTGNEIEGQPEGNLCIEAFRIFNEIFKLKGSFFVHLHKKIPTGAGMGGGSADGAFALNMINDICNTKASMQQLIGMAGKLGSDCAAFIINTPAFGMGRGEILEPVNVDLKGYHLVVIKPRVHVKTSEAFGDINPATHYESGSIRKIVQSDPAHWNGQLSNDFENTVFIKYPAIREIKQKLINAGAEYASMTGSGSAVFGLSKKKINADIVFQDCFNFYTVL